MCNLINTPPSRVNRYLLAEGNRCCWSGSIPGGLYPHSLSMGHELTCLLCGPGGTFRVGVGGIDRALPARDNNRPASKVEREGRARGRTASGGKVQFSDSTDL